jgi:predicted phage terminase large subunit-like protein
MAVTRGHGPSPGHFRGAIYGANVWWVTSTFPTAANIWRQLKRASREFWINSQRCKSEQEHRIEFPSGGSVTVKSADNPDSLVGDGLDGMVFDEAALSRSEAWKISLRPALTDKQGWTIFISTPRGDNWFKELFDAANQNGWQRWQLPTAQNPVIPPAELEAARLDMGPRAFAQEHEAQFIDAEGVEFSGEYFGDRIWFDQWPRPDEILHRVIALDPSKGKSEKSDFSAFVKIALDFNGIMWIDADIERRDTRRIVSDGIVLHKEFYPELFAVEVNQFQEVLADNLAEAARASGIMPMIYPIVNTVNKVTRIRATLTPFLARQEFRFKRGSRGAKLLVEQLKNFPIDGHDDGPDALEMGVRTLRFLFEGGAKKQQSEQYPVVVGVAC